MSTTCMLVSTLSLLVLAVSEYDVIVVGGTPSGVITAVAAARAGSQRVLLLEPSPYVGGMMANGLGTSDFGVRSDTIGGLAEEFFQRVAVHYNYSFAYPNQLQCTAPAAAGWTFEPHVAEAIFIEMLDEGQVTVRTGARVSAVSWRATAGEPSIAAVQVLGEQQLITGKVFCDATYEGSLMKLSRVSYTFGREARDKYNEPSAGRLPIPNTTESAGWSGGDIWHCAFRPGINPYIDPANTSVVAGVADLQIAAVGGADRMVGSLDWRLTLCAGNRRVPLPPPANYHPEDYELIRRVIASGWKPPMTPRYTLPNNKSDWKVLAGGDSLAELLGSPASEYANASWERQAEIQEEYKQFSLGLFEFFRRDLVVPADVRASVQGLGLCVDEFNQSGHWPGQMYVREALRMVSDTVLTEGDVVGTVFRNKSDTIGLGAYTVDVPGPAQRVVFNGEVVNEGSIKVPYFCDPKLAPYALPFAIMTPRRGEANNLLVPVAVSASHVAFNSLRMEPQWMILGHAAGVAAAMAASTSSGVRDVQISALQAKLRAQGQILEPVS